MKTSTRMPFGLIAFLLMTWQVGFGQTTDPTPQTLPFTFTEQSSATVLPDGMGVGAENGSDGEHFDETGDASSGGSFCQWNDEGANGISYQASGSCEDGSILVAINTLGTTSISVDWTARLITDNANVNYFTIQYRVGTSGDFTSLSDTYNSSTDGASASYTTNLPVAAEGEAVVQVRWAYYEIGTGSRDRLAIDDINITGTTSSCVISDISVSNAGSCNDNGTPSDDSDDYYEADVTVTYTDDPGTGTLDLSGSGVVGGTTSAAVGTSPQTISGVRLAANGSDVAITATFSDDLACTYSETVSGTDVASCSNFPNVGFVITSSSIAEGDAGTSQQNVSISMDSAPSSDATIDVISIEDSATEGVDYDAVSTSVTFTTGESYPATKMVSVTINGDTDEEPSETFDLLLSLAVGSAGLAAVGDDQHTVTISNDDFAPIACPSGTESQSQGFEGGGTWSYTVIGNSQALPCSSGDDYVGEGTTIGTGGNTISSSGGSQFFAVRDITGDCAGSSGVDLSFSTFTATAMTAGNYAISFDYNVFGWDTGDDISYNVSVNSSSVAAGDAVSGFSNFSTSGWETQTIDVVLAAGDALDFTITLDQNGDGDWGGIDNVVLCFGAIFPVNLTSFEAKPEGNKALLTWQTSTEQNNSHFLIQRSADGRLFENIGRVEGAGDSDQAIDYSFVDDKPLPGLNYYRLHQFDFDGTNEIFSPIAVRFGEAGDKPSAWPVPTSDLLQVSLPATEESWLLEVFNLNGQRLLEQLVEDKTTQTSLDVRALPAGSYFLRWTNGRNSGQQRFLKN